MIDEPPGEPDELLTIKQAAELLALSEVTLRRWDRAGKLRAERRPGCAHRLYRRSVLEALAREPVDGPVAPTLRAPVASFIGRTAELAALRAAFARGARLVTIVGPPGAGKTRLARRHAELAGAGLPGGVWFCDATAIADEMPLRHAIATALATSLSSASLDVLGAALARRRPLLLIVDNAEDLGQPARRLLPTLCALAAPLRVLVTSREPLGVDAEELVELGPFAVPPEAASDADVLASDAVALLLARSRSPAVLARRPRDLAALIRALDGLPLAIELAAPHLTVLSPRELLARLGSVLDLAAPTPSPQARHHSLRDALDASWHLLGEPERAALAQCAVFVSGFTLAAAEAVIAVPGASASTLLAALRDRSLVALHPGAHRGPDRFVLYESIRVYAAERLAPADRAAAELRHARHYLEHGEAAHARENARSDGAANQELLDELGNLSVVFARRLAAARSGEPGAGVDALRTAVCLSGVLRGLGRFPEVVAQFDAALPLAGDAPEPLRLRAELARAHALGNLGELERSFAELRRATAAAAALGDVVVEGDGQLCLSAQYQRVGLHEEALVAGARARELCAAAGQRQLEALALMLLGVVHGELGRSAEARASAEAALKIGVELGERWCDGLAHGALALLEQEAGRFEAARVRYEAATRAYRLGGDIVFEALFQGLSGTLAHEQALAGPVRAETFVEAARGAYTAALAALGAAGFYLEGLFHGFLAALEASFGEPGRALVEFDVAATRLERLAAPAYLATLEVLRGIPAQRRAAQGDPEAAREVAARIQGAQSWRGRSMTVRTALRMLAAAGMGSGATAAWVVGPGARWFAPPGGPRVSLQRRGPVRRILDALVTAQREAPGTAFTPEALLGIGWPGERVRPDAGLLRVRVAVATLRSFGLRERLITRDDGYLLDPAMALERGE